MEKEATTAMQQPENSTHENSTPETQSQQSTSSPTDQKATTGTAAEPNGKTYTDAQLEDLKSAWLKEQEETQTAEKDFAKMTPAQQAQKLLEDQKVETARLKAELQDRDLSDYARSKLATEQLPAEALPFIKGRDQAQTDANIKAFSVLLAAGVQAGVETRFQVNGYTPRGSAAGHDETSTQKKPRGVTVNKNK